MSEGLRPMPHGKRLSSSEQTWHMKNQKASLRKRDENIRSEAQGERGHRFFPSLSFMHPAVCKISLYTHYNSRSPFNYGSLQARIILDGGKTSPPVPKSSQDGFMAKPVSFQFPPTFHISSFLTQIRTSCNFIRKNCYVSEI